MAQINTQRWGKPGRTAFTLVELLIVVALIGILAALTAAAAMRVFGTQQRSTTRTILTRSSSGLNKQASYVTDLARKVPLLNMPGAQKTFLLGMANQDVDRAMVIHTKFLYRQWFPTTFAEALYGPAQIFVANGNATAAAKVASFYPPLPGYTTYLNMYNINTGTIAANAAPAPYESAACLYMILQRGPERAGEDDLGLTANSSTYGAFKIPMMVDSWTPPTTPPSVPTGDIINNNDYQRNPLLFCRWPTGDLTIGGGGSGSSYVNPAGVTAGNSDPLDPKGLLTAPIWWASSGPLGNNRTAFEMVFHPLPATAGSSLNLKPVIVSSGPDGAWGYLQTFPPANLAQPQTTQLTTLAYGQTRSWGTDNLYSSDLDH